MAPIPTLKGHIKRRNPLLQKQHKLSDHRANVAEVVGPRPVTGGLLVRTHIPSICRCVLGQDTSPNLPVMLVRGPRGADSMAASLLSVCPRAAVATLQLTTVSV
ncbi:hypothetical protein AMECASPLE_016211 [Ameca splendens]|uniref:Uncharacterized protein n=1 Tax=Ameca splendens TaxID=208324 RepID=A0ABV1A9K2_9TELE